MSGHGPKGPPPEDRIRALDAARPQPEGRDITPAVGTRGQPGKWQRAIEGASVALQRPGYEDGRWSFLYDKATRYAKDAAAANGRVVQDARRMRAGDQGPVEVRGAVNNPAVWRWELPLYVWIWGSSTG